MKTLILSGFALLNSIAHAGQQLNIFVDELPLAAAISKSGEIFIHDYPEIEKGKMNVIQARTFQLGSQIDEICMNAERIVGLTEKSFVPDLTKRRYVEVIRNLNQFSLGTRIPAIMNRTYLERAALRDLAGSGQHFPAVFLVNPLSVDSFELSYSFADDSLSKRLGNEDSHAASIASLFSAQTQFTGFSVATFSAADLLCDLWQGKATVQVHLKGYYREFPLLHVDDSEIDEVEKSGTVNKPDNRAGQAVKSPTGSVIDSIRTYESHFPLLLK